MIYANPMNVASEVLGHLHWREWKVHEYHYGEKDNVKNSIMLLSFQRFIKPALPHNMKSHQLQEEDSEHHVSNLCFRIIKDIIE